ncbi:hypothetical protein [Blastopirellula retiformator]|uniref:Nicotinate-nucleotide adenylyltransferase n=1 Tax=Blastopirellula retiformator TaxID=2527970 RepID=A0A5C5V3I2_9BACT|nr:hypothetical protein [Blastopirellula retiformator]TWT33126.1 nicotinate-nucleotide adenylyltransferase [Blastopirellula retiformator]
MPYVQPTQLIRQLHLAPNQLVMAVTGGGSEAISSLLQVPGASQTLLEAIVPYSGVALADLLKRPPEQYCSEATARAMAVSAFLRARKLWHKSVAAGDASGEQPPLMGIGCTASMKSHLAKKGPHRVHLAIQTPEATTVANLVLTKEARTRDEEEKLTAELILDRVATAAGLTETIRIGLMPGEQVDETVYRAQPSWRELLQGDIRACIGSGEPASPADHSGAIMSGAFNPLHEGHLEMAAVGEQILGRRVDYEISIENVEKAPLDFGEMAERVEQYEPPQRCWLTRAPTFVEKARIFPEATFVVGADTIVRIADTRYYHDSEKKRDAAIREFSEQNCRFLVFPRQVKGEFLTLDEIELPTPLRRLCDGVSPDLFRADISSTEIRRRLSEFG